MEEAAVIIIGTPPPETFPDSQSSQLWDECQALAHDVRAQVITPSEEHFTKLADAVQAYDWSAMSYRLGGMDIVRPYVRQSPQ